jgi:hypothetical protein
MFNRSERFSSPEPHRIRRVPGSPNSEQLLDDQVLEELLGRLEDMPADACYPLQIAFYEKMLGCDLVLPVPAGTNLQQGLPIVMLENPRGEKGLPLFTNEHNLASWVEEPTDYVILPFTTLCGYALRRSWITSS